MWVRAGAILANLEPTKRKAIANDALIAISALSIGAAVVTRNAPDFGQLARFTPLTWFGSVEEALAAVPAPKLRSR